MAIVAKRLDESKYGTWHGSRPWSSPHCVRWAHSSPPQNRGQNLPPTTIFFGTSLLWPNGCMHQDATWYGGRLRAEAYATLCSMWTQLPPEKGHTHPTQFLAHVYCGQMAAWMKTPLRTEVNLSPGHTVLDGVLPPTKGAQQPPSFRSMSIVIGVAHLSATAELFYGRPM